MKGSVTCCVRRPAVRPYPDAASIPAVHCLVVPDPVLVTLVPVGRVSVNAARSNPQVASYAPVELNRAVATLRQAEDLAARGGRMGEVQQLAMLANQRAALAQEMARTRSEEAALMVQRRANGRS